VALPEKIAPPPLPAPSPPPKPPEEAPAPPPPFPPPFPPDPRPDPVALKLAQEAAQEALLILAKWPKDQPLAVEVFDERGSAQPVEGTLVRAGRSRLHLRTRRGNDVIELGEVTPNSLAAVLLSRNEKGADLLRRFEKELAPEGEKEQEARSLFHQAERDHRDFAARVDAVGKYRVLLKEHADTAFVRRNQASILERADSGKEYWFFPGNMAAGGAMKAARHPKAGDCLTAAADVTESSATITFSTLPGVAYRCWVYVGGCCGEVLTFQAEGSELAASRVRNSLSVITRHSGHGGPKQPSKWGWASISLPKYSAPGAKTVRLVTTQTGFSVAVAVVSAVRKSPPTEIEVRDAERPELSEPAPPDLELWLRFDESGGPWAKDASRRGQTCLLVGDAQRLDQALSVDRDGHVRVADAPHLRFRADQSFTVAAWARASERRGGYQGIVTKSRDQKPHYGLWTGHGKWVFGGSQQNIEAGSVATEWQHVVGVQDGPAGKRTLYVNGVPIGSAGAQPGDGPGELRVGATAGPTEYFGGQIDEVRIYSRALTSEEVVLLYKEGR
jgi:hypothetical protein